MKTTRSELRSAIDACARAEKNLTEAKDKLRAAVRHHLQVVTADRGSVTALAGRIGVSFQVLANLKSGIGATSWKWAEKLWRDGAK